MKISPLENLPLNHVHYHCDKSSKTLMLSFSMHDKKMLLKLKDYNRKRCNEYSQNYNLTLKILTHRLMVRASTIHSLPYADK